MKKIALLLVSLSLLAYLASCNSSPETPAETTQAETTPVETTPPAPPIIEIYPDPGNGEKGDGPTVNDSTTFEDIIRSKPTKEGYVFAGWYSDENFKDYIDPNHITATQYSKGKAYAKWISSAKTTYQVRDYEVSISDAGRKKQQMDIVEISTSADYTLLDLERAGFTYIEVEITLDIKEVNDGYQYIFLYKDDVLPDTDMDLTEFYNKYVNGESSTEDPSLLHLFKYEHGPGEKDTSWNRVTFRRSLRISDLKDDLYIRYGASGKDDDTWRNQNVSVTITPTR